jgi:threonine synthase
MFFSSWPNWRTRVVNRASIGEGNTPLIASVRIGPALGASRLFLKLESCNPSGSYKDRFVAAEISCALKSGARACVATSSGNTGSSLAAYCARYDLRCIVLANQDAPVGKLAQMQAHGASVLRIPDFVTDPRVTDAVFATLRAFSASAAVPLIVSAYRYCPVGMAGVESIAAEIRAQAQGPVDHVFVPVGGGGLYSAVVRGFERGGEPIPRIHAVQPRGCPTVVAAYERGDSEIRPVVSTTRISGLSVPFDIDASLALACLRRRGVGIAVADESVFAAQRMLFEQEGVYCEPAGAAALAGWIEAIQRGIASREESAVCLITGHGFKDPVSVEAAAKSHPSPVVRGDGVRPVLEELIAQR